MSGSRFANLRKLLGGTALGSVPEDDERDDAPNAGGGNGGPTAAAIEAAVAADISAATTAANVRWNTVMTSDAGAANPKAAARMLNTSTMAADDVVATLVDIGAGTPAASADETAAAEARAARLEKDRLALAEDGTADPKTGPAGGGPAARQGRDEASMEVTRSARKKAQDKRNAQAAKKGGVTVNATA